MPTAARTNAPNRSSRSTSPQSTRERAKPARRATPSAAAKPTKGRPQASTERHSSPTKASPKGATSSSDISRTFGSSATRTKTAAEKPSSSKASPAKKPRIYTISFASVYPLYVDKVEKKGRTKEELDKVITWLTGYDRAGLKRAIDSKADLETFFANAPRLNPKAYLITGVVCGIRVEEIADPLTQKIRYLDKLVDELARGKKLESVLRA